jgi:hypothetical protein
MGVPTAINRKVKLLAGRGIPQEHIRQLVRNPQTGKPVSVKTLERAFATEINASRPSSFCGKPRLTPSRARSAAMIRASLFQAQDRAIDDFTLKGICAGIIAEPCGDFYTVKEFNEEPA